jgi:hypothetical protein
MKTKTSTARPIATEASNFGHSGNSVTSGAK